MTKPAEKSHPLRPHKSTSHVNEFPPALYTAYLQIFLYIIVLATAFSMVWYKIAMQRFREVYDERLVSTLRKQDIRGIFHDITLDELNN